MPFVYSQKRDVAVMLGHDPHIADWDGSVLTELATLLASEGEHYVLLLMRPRCFAALETHLASTKASRW